MTPLHRLARHHGLTLEYDAPGGGVRAVPDATLDTILRGLGVDPDATPEGAAAAEAMPAPQARCHLPDDLRDRPGWGIFCQLYELRSATNWGIGDFADLATLAGICGAAGADFLGVNPLHALFLARPEHASPFSPSNRRFLNPLYVAPGALGCAAPPEVEALRAAEVVDYTAVAAAKLPSLRAAFDAFGGDPAFDAFVAKGGEALRLHAVFETIDARQPRSGWPNWDAELRDPAGPAVAVIAEAEAATVRFHLWLQWVADDQLARAQRAAREAGMRIGLYLDLAVGEAPDGSATWSGAAAALPGVTVGAPPDMFSQEGQGWGLSAPSPRELERLDLAPFRAMIRAQIRHAGALRIDHVMALRQLYLIPDGRPPLDGTHLRYPMEAMLDVLAEESRAAGAVVIGEDLGWVPEGFRDAMGDADVLSYRIVVFEQDADGFHPAADYPAKAMACLSTHDLPVLEAWWRGDDIDRRHRHGLVGAEDTAAGHAHRAQERVWMAERLGIRAPTADAPPEGLLEAGHRFIAATPCLLAGVRLADLAGPDVPTNVPGVPEARGDYPNWRPRSPTVLEALSDRPAFRDITALMRESRPR